jgi:hypothetical protein
MIWRAGRDAGGGASLVLRSIAGMRLIAAKTCALARLDARSHHLLGQLAWIFDSGPHVAISKLNVHHGQRLL